MATGPCVTHGLGSRDTRTNVQNGFKERNGEPLAVPKQQWWQERFEPWAGGYAPSQGCTGFVLAALAHSLEAKKMDLELTKLCHGGN